MTNDTDVTERKEENRRGGGVVFFKKSTFQARNWLTPRRVEPTYTTRYKKFVRYRKNKLRATGLGNEVRQK